MVKDSLTDTQRWENHDISPVWKAEFKDKYKVKMDIQIQRRMQFYFIHTEISVSISINKLFYTHICIYTSYACILFFTHGTSFL